MAHFSANVETHADSHPEGIQTRTDTVTSTCVHVCAQTRMDTVTSTCVQVCTQTRMDTETSTCVHVCTQTWMDTVGAYALR